MTSSPILILLLALWPAVSSVAATEVDFVREVRPILQEHCYACHAGEQSKGGFRLDIKSQAFKGGDSYGEAILAGNPAASPLVQFVSDPDADLVMPPEGPPLSAEEVATLQAWVQQGAVWPDGVDLAKLEDRTDHWSFKPLKHPSPPQIPDGDWPRSAIDNFVIAKLHQTGLAPAPPADPAVWLRRVSLDLTGLPPTPERMQSFLGDSRPDARARVVEELLASPEYGERWGQHWLDVVRYADTHGFEVNTERPNAWPYRDYVIRAFNADTPYSRFITEQLAGDALGEGAATGFLITASVLLPGQIGKDAPSIRLARQDALDEIVVNISQTFLGLSVGCARCHDHKFDPVSQREYYAMQAFVAGVEYADRELQTPQAQRQRQEQARLQKQLAEIERRLTLLEPRAMSGVSRPPVNAKLNVDRFTPLRAQRVRFTIAATNRLEPCIDELEVFNADGVNIALASAGTKVSSSGDITVADRHELRFVNDGLYGNSRSWMSSEMGRGWVELEFPEAQEITHVLWGRDREGKYDDRLALEYRIEASSGGSDEWTLIADSTDRATPKDDKKPRQFSTQGLSSEEAALAGALMAEREQLQRKIDAAEVGQVAFSGKFREPDEIRLLLRGDPEQPKDEVQPAVAAALGDLTLPEDAPEQQRRLELAEWIADPQNPLTARVMVNRIWQGHFGTGLVETSSDFGRSGAAPSHPELLDWLAAEFIRSGWSVKHMHRLIVLSATYGQSTRFDSAAAALDADGRLLWRFPLRRLEAEAIRDSMLAVSGTLNRSAGGPGFDLFDKRGGLTGFNPVESFQADGRRRMIYAHKVRRERDGVFGAFDCPDGGQSASRRRESTTPIQALNLLNSRFTLEQSAAFAARVQAEAGERVPDQIARAWRLALGRGPRPEESEDALSIVRKHGLATLCRVLFNANEFLFLP